MFTFRRALAYFRLALPVATLALLLTAPATLAQTANRPTVTEQEALTTLAATQAGFRYVHDKVMPAVVSITSQVEVSNARDDTPMSPFDFFFGAPQRNTPEVVRSSGSGVIIDPKGIIVTNSHVVDKATKVTVQLSGQDKLLPAEVLQTDARTDLAVIRITEKGTYPSAALGDASAVKVGDWAIAFGSPFRLSSTMTIGVISATGRQLRAPTDEYTYRDLLQTDASINPGNSGGALVNIKGEVIGINFMIYSPGSSSGSVGIGFAIPINDYTKTIIQTMARGEVPERGRLGVVVKNLDDAMRQHYGVASGILVDSVVPGQAADKAGLKAEDVILEFNGTKVTDADQFVRLVELTKPGTQTTVMIIRDRKEQKITMTVGAMPTATAAANVNEKKVGMTVDTITPDIAERLGMPGIRGVLVASVTQGSAAEDAGLQRLEVITLVGFDQITSKEEFWTSLSKNMTASKLGVVMRVRRGNTATTITLPPIAD